ncbi:MAG: hypothetical protein ACLR02_00940 [Clostridium sp.]|jgi:hypothetical protein|nr:hypothetical protein [Clostridium sp.]
MGEKIDFKEICKEIKCEEIYGKKVEELNNDEMYYLNTYLEDNYKNMKRNLLELLPTLNLDPNQYKVGGKILIPIEEKEFCKRAFKLRTASISKKMRGKSKKEITIEDIEKEIESIEKIAYEVMSEEEAKFEVGKIKYQQNLYTLKKIEEVKSVVQKNIYDKMEQLMLTDFSLNGQDATLLIDFYSQMIEIYSKQWDDIVKSYKEIKEENIESRVVTDDSTYEYYVDESIELKNPQSILKEALEERYKNIEEYMMKIYKINLSAK